MRKILAGLIAAGVALVLSGCGSDAVAADSVYANEGATIGISMPNQTSSRWTRDGDSMTTQFKSMGYQVDLQYAEDDPNKQSQQIKSMIDGGAKLLVISAVDGDSLSDVLSQASAKDVDILAYDRLLMNTMDVDYQATFDNERVGEMQADFIVNQLGLNKSNNDGPYNIELFAGSPTDSNAQSFYDGSMSVLQQYIDDGDLVVRSNTTKFKRIAIAEYNATKAQNRMKNLLSQYYSGTEKVDAVLSPYDGMTIGIIKALKAAGYGTATNPLPITTGQDAEVASVKSIIAGDQTETIFKDSRELAKVAVQQANALLTETSPLINDTSTYNNGKKTVQTYVLPPVEVTKSNYQALLIDSTYITAADLA